MNQHVIAPSSLAALVVATAQWSECDGTGTSGDPGLKPFFDSLDAHRVQCPH